MPTLPTEAFPFCGESYAVSSAVIDCQRSINLYPETEIRSSKTPVALIGTPGLTNFTTLPGGVCRALWAGNGRLFAIGGTHFYELSTTAGVILTDYGAMAGSLGTGPCQIVQGVGPAFNLLVMDSSVPGVFFANPVGPVMTLTFDGTALEYLDGFFIAIAKPVAGVTQNQLNVTSDGSTLASWNALNFVNRTGSQDLVNQIAVMNSRLWVFGQKRIEVWYNAGNPGVPFQRVQGATIDKGLVAPFSVAKTDDALIWLGADDRGWAGVYQTVGLQPVRVSTFGIDTLINVSYGTDINTARAFTYQEAGHTFYVLNFPTGTVVYDVTTKQWHERGFLSGGSIARWKPNSFACPNLFTGSVPINFVGDYSSGNVYQMKLSITSDNGSTIRRIRTAPHIANHNQWIKYRRFELDADLGTATPVLDYSNDGGRNFQVGTLAYTMTKSTASTPGGGGQYYALQLGRSRDRVFRITINDDANVIRIVNAYVDASPGIEK